MLVRLNTSRSRVLADELIYLPPVCLDVKVFRPGRCLEVKDQALYIAKVAAHIILPAGEHSTACLPQGIAQNVAILKHDAFVSRNAAPVRTVRSPAKDCEDVLTVPVANSLLYIQDTGRRDAEHARPVRQSRWHAGSIRCQTRLPETVKPRSASGGRRPSLSGIRACSRELPGAWYCSYQCLHPRQSTGRATGTPRRHRYRCQGRDPWASDSAARPPHNPKAQDHNPGGPARNPSPAYLVQRQQYISTPHSAQRSSFTDHLSRPHLDSSRRVRVTLVSIGSLFPSAGTTRHSCW